MSSVSWGGVTVFGNNNLNSSSTGGFSFGSTTPSTPTTTFGASSPSTTTTSLFGSSNNTTNAGSTPATTSAFSFSSPATTPSLTSTSLFGNTKSPAASNTTAMNLFGTPTTTPTHPTVVPTAATPAQAALQAQVYAQQLQEASQIESSLSKIHTAYTSTGPPPPTTTLATHPNSASNADTTKIPFQHILYDKLEQHPELQQYMISGSYQYPPRPTHISSQKWAEALARNPDSTKYTPVYLVGVDALSSRISKQQEKAKILKDHASTLRETLTFLQERHISSLQKIRYFQQQNDNHLRQRMLMCMRKAEVLRCMNLPIQSSERDVREELSHVWTKVSQLADQVRNVQNMAESYLHEKDRMEKEHHGYIMQNARGEHGLLSQLSEEDKRNLAMVMEESGVGLERLVSVVKKDVRDVAIMKEYQRILYSNRG